MKAFKAYDIRGIYGIDFTKEDVYKIGLFLPELLKSDKILVGRDVRISSPEVWSALSKGITDAGADMYDAGLTTTPQIYWGTSYFNFEASVQITASHNAKEYNGLKISRSKTVPVGYDSGLAKLEEMITTEQIEISSAPGQIIEFPFHDKYLAFLKKHLDDISNIKMGIDASNGMAGLFVHELFGDDPFYIFDEPDGLFPNHSPNPLKPESIEDLQKLVLVNNCDIGLIFDGDADRVMFVDEKGQFISPDLIIAVLAHHFQEELQNEKVLIDIRTSKSVSEYIKKFNCEVEMWRVGRAYAAVKLKEINGIYGGELAGHYYFRDFYYSDSGLLAAILVLNIINEFKNKGITTSQLIGEIATYANSGEINFRIEKKAEAMEKIKDHFIKTESPTAIYDFDGYRIEFEDWWFNIRPSNTEPYLRFIAEARSADLLKERVNKVRELISDFQ